MGFFEDSIVKAKEVIDIAGKKTGEMISLQKLKVNASSLQYQISKDYEALGRLCYEARQNGEKNEDAISELIEEMDARKAELAELDRQIALAKGILICPACSARNAITAAYCNRCGIKLENAETEGEAADVGAEEKTTKTEEPNPAEPADAGEEKE